MAKWFRFPWAVNGDRAPIVDESQSVRELSYQNGYGADYQRDLELDPQARSINRQRYNQALFDITSTLQQYYQHSVPPFIHAADNGGQPHSYQPISRVLFNNRVYESEINNNTAPLPPIGGWWTY